MKKTIIYTVLSIAFVFISCDSFLDIQPVGQVIPNNIEEYRALLASAYKSVPGRDRGITSFRSDEMQVRDDEYDLSNYREQECWEDISSTASSVSYSWANYYQAIFTSNQVIINRNKIEYTKKEEVDQLVGEAYLLRAYMHFLLVNLHGQPYTKEGALQTKSIPLRLDNDFEKSIYRNTVEEVYQSVLSDIEEAQKLLNVTEWEITKSYRFTKQAADALSARVALYMGEWKSAYEAAMLIIENPLYSIEDLAKENPVIPNSYLSSESITALEQTLSSSVNRAAEITPLFLQRYNKEDLRLNTYYSEPNEKGIRKPQKGGSNTFSMTFRLSEFILTAAEAAAQLDNLQKSKELLLLLAEKRYTSAGYAARKDQVNKLNKQELITEVLEERSRELALEGHRWFDLRRTTRPRIEKSLKNTNNNEMKTYILEQDDPRYTIPIPRSAIEANPNLAN